MNRTLLIASTIVLASSSPAPAQDPRPTPLPSVTLPAELDRVLRDYERAWHASDVKVLVALFTEDGFVLQPGRQPARGHAALTQTYSGQTGGDLRLRALAFQASDSTGFIIGAYRYGDATDDAGKFTLTLRRDRGGGGKWLIVSDMDNGNAPRRPAAPPETQDGSWLSSSC